MSKNAKEYVPLVLPIADRYVNSIAAHLKEDGRLHEDTSIRELTGLFALEAVMKVVVGVDFPALTKPLHPDALNFIKAVEIMFDKTTTVENMPFLATINAKPYRELKTAWRELYRYPSETLEPALDYYKQHGKLPDDCNGTVLPRLLQEHEHGALSLEEVRGIGAQAVAAAVDTTSQTFEYLLYNLGRNPDVQDKLLSEITLVTGANNSGERLDMTIQEYESLKYLFACVKESMRLTPTIGVHARTLTDDIDVGKYIFPKGTMALINYYEMTKNPDIFPEPDLFMPERFMKDPSSSDAGAACPMLHPRKEQAVAEGKAVVNDSYAAIPFGHGGRKCAGKGFAEMDMHLALAALLCRYKIEYDGPELVQIERNLLRPKEPLSPYIKLTPRA